MSISRDGAAFGEGKPEKLKVGQGYSRRFDEKNRMVTTTDENEIKIDSCYGHYEK